MTIVPKKKSDSRTTAKQGVGVATNQNTPNNNLDEHGHHTHQGERHEPHPSQADLHPTSRRSPLQCTSRVQLGDEDVDYSGYNSGDEYSHDRRKTYMQCSEQEFQEREMQFEKKINKKGWVIKKMAEDGACLFRAVADQIYGDQEMHKVVRKLCIDYIVSIQEAELIS